MQAYTTPVAVVGEKSFMGSDWYSRPDGKAVLFLGTGFPGVVLVERDAYNDVRAQWVRSLKANGVFGCVDAQSQNKANALELGSDGKLGCWTRNYDISNICLADFDPNHLHGWATAAANAAKQPSKAT